MSLSKNLERTGEVLENLNKLLGPHFRFEEEALYPILRRFLGEYIYQLLSEHDEGIKSAKEVDELV